MNNYIEINTLFILLSLCVCMRMLERAYERQKERKRGREFVCMQTDVPQSKCVG